ncbi:hypothetical protein MSPP1_001688 [Malassezia sp. CBS 17886]|nr:hypothetical protein MSPP1_001688 [Malassezia sp. CBS 17886]
MSAPYSFRPGGALKLKGDGANAETSDAPGERTQTKQPAAESGQSTKAEQHFEEIRRKRMQEQVRREARKSHKDKVDSFNTYLERLTDHNDMPRIGGGG